MKRILVTRARAQADEFAGKLHAAGFEPVYFPVIEIKPVENNVALQRAFAKLDCYEWIVFTSVNAVDIVFDQLPSSQWSGNTRVAAIGPRTAAALKARGLTPDFVPDEYVAEAILPGLGDLPGKWVLLPRAEVARKELPEAIFRAGGVPHEITIYQTIPAMPDAEALAALRSGVDVITFTSESTVQTFISITKQNGFDPFDLPNDPIFACIGPITGQAARDVGLSNVIVAREYTTEGLITALKQMEVL